MRLKMLRILILVPLIFANLVIISEDMLVHSSRASDSARGTSSGSFAFPRNCIIPVPNGSTVRDVHTVKFADGSTHQYSPADCAMGQAATINGWIEYGYNYYGNGGATGFTYLANQWQVPWDPANQQNNLIYLFNSLQWWDPTNPQHGWIIQPVLGWGYQNVYCPPICTAGGHYWYLENEIVFNSFLNEYPAYASGAPSASAGDIIRGTISWQSYSDECGEPMYTITESDSTNGASTVLNFCTDTLGTEANPGVLEAYNINSCDELPQYYGVTFSNTVSTPSVSSIGNWYGAVYGGSPSCNYGASASADGGSFYLQWDSQPPPPPPPPGGGGGGSVAFGTLVTMADGTTKAVQNLKSGDQIIVYNVPNGYQGTARVTGLDTVTASTTLTLFTDGGRPLRTDTSPKMQLWVLTSNGPVREPVASIHSGDKIYNYDLHSWVTVTNVTTATGGQHTLFDPIYTPQFTANGDLLEYIANGYPDVITN